MKTSELIGEALDWAVLKAQNQDFTNFNIKYMDVYPFSTDWAQGGPIIERECIDLQYQGGDSDIWAADMCGNESSIYGNTPLIAAMRCYVTSKMGDDVEPPRELL